MNNKYLFSWFFIIIVLIIFVFGVAFYEIKLNDEETVSYTDFTRTYTLLYYTDSDDEDYVFITLKRYQVDDVATVKVSRDLMPSLEIDESYEFHFNYEGVSFEDNIYNIFYYMELDEVEITSLTGTSQRNDNL